MKNLFSKWYVWILILIPVGFIVWYYVIRKKENNTSNTPVVSNTPVIPLNNTINTGELPPSDIIDAYTSNGQRFWYSPTTSFYYALGNGYVVKKSTNIEDLVIPNNIMYGGVLPN